MTDVTGAAPETRNLSFLLLLFGASAAPIFWVGQLSLSYVVTAVACYPGDHPTATQSASSLVTAMMIFDIVAIVAALTGGIVSLLCLRRVQNDKGVTRFGMAEAGTGRARFLAIWGVFSSLWFFLAILFNTYASMMVSPCLS